MRLSPRKSFEAWKVELREHCAPWTLHDRAVASALRSSLTNFMLLLRVAEISRQRMLIAELNHRVKNTLSLVSSLLNQGKTTDGPVDDFVASMEGRVRALAHAHDHVERVSASGLRNMLISEAAPYGDAADRLKISGPPVVVTARSFPVLTLVIHELMTNAAKYGSLSVPEGIVQVDWSLDRKGALEIRWRERGGPKVEAPLRTGFGTLLLNRNIPFELGGEAHIRYSPGGLEADLVLPGQHIESAGGVEPQLRRPSATDPERLRTIEGLSVLLVEDQMMIALNAQAMLRECGASHVQIVANISAALEAVKRRWPAVAVLDVNLGDTDSMPVARRLRAAEVPFIFATAYGDSIAIPAEFHDIPVARKPYTAAALSQALRLAVPVELLSNAADAGGFN